MFATDGDRHGAVTTILDAIYGRSAYTDPLEAIAAGVPEELAAGVARPVSQIVTERDGLLADLAAANVDINVIATHLAHMTIERDQAIARLDYTVDRAEKAEADKESALEAAGRVTRDLDYALKELGLRWSATLVEREACAVALEQAGFSIGIGERAAAIVRARWKVIAG